MKKRILLTLIFVGLLLTVSFRAVKAQDEIAPTDAPVSPKMSASIPGHGAEKPHGFIGMSGLFIKIPPEISVPPE